MESSLHEEDLDAVEAAEEAPGLVRRHRGHREMRDARVRKDIRLVYQFANASWFDTKM